MPQQLYDMELWEFNCCVRAYNEKQAGEGQEQIAISWQTAALTGAAFAGKLKRLNHYLKDNETKRAPAISREEFDERLKRAERRVCDGASTA
jgi:hypothetical protein